MKFWDGLLGLAAKRVYRTDVGLGTDFVEKVASLKSLQICQSANEIFDRR